MENKLGEPLIGKSRIETKPQNKTKVEKKFKKYEDLIESEIDKVKKLDMYKILTGHTDSVSSVAISQDGKYLISGSADATIKVWNLKERREEFTLTGHTSKVSSVAISQDGK